MDILQRECSLRSTFWLQQRQQEEKLLRDLERSLHHCFQAATQSTEHVQDFQVSVSVRAVVSEGQCVHGWHGQLGAYVLWSWG